MRTIRGTQSSGPTGGGECSVASRCTLIAIDPIAAAILTPRTKVAAVRSSRPAPGTSHIEVAGMASERLRKGRDLRAQRIASAILRIESLGGPQRDLMRRGGNIALRSVPTAGTYSSTANEWPM